MINKVVAAGRIMAPPQVQAVPPALKLRLELDHVSWDGEYQEQCRVQAVLYGERRVSGLEPYLEEGRLIAIDGHLREGTDGPEIVIKQLEFLQNGIASTPLWCTPASVAP